MKQGVTQKQLKKSAKQLNNRYKNVVKNIADKIKSYEVHINGTSFNMAWIIANMMVDNLEESEVFAALNEIQEDTLNIFNKYPIDKFEDIKEKIETGIKDRGRYNNLFVGCICDDAYTRYAKYDMYEIVLESMCVREKLGMSVMCNTVYEYLAIAVIVVCEGMSFIARCKYVDEGYLFSMEYITQALKSSDEYTTSYSEFLHNVINDPDVEKVVESTTVKSKKLFRHNIEEELVEEFKRVCMLHHDAEWNEDIECITPHTMLGVLDSVMYRSKCNVLHSLTELHAIKRVKELQTKLTEAEKELATLKDVKQQVKNIEKINKDLVQVKEKYDKVVKENTDLKALINNNEEINKLKKEKSELISTNKRLEKSLVKLEANRVALNDKKDAIQNELDKDKIEIKKLKEINEQLNKMLKEQEALCDNTSDSDIAYMHEAVKDKKIVVLGGPKNFGNRLCEYLNNVKCIDCDSTGGYCGDLGAYDVVCIYFDAIAHRVVRELESTSAFMKSKRVYLANTNRKLVIRSIYDEIVR